MKRVSLGYTRVKDVRGLPRVELVPISKEKALAILRGGRPASEGLPKGGAQR